MRMENFLKGAGVALLAAGIAVGLLHVITSSHTETNDYFEIADSSNTNFTLVSRMSGSNFTIASTFCEDLLGKVMVGNKPRRCKWIGNNNPNACYNYEGVRQYCPVTCNACADLCLDVPYAFNIDGQNLMCDAGTDDPSYCSKSVFATNCPFSCDQCTFTSIVPSALPLTSLPTSTPSLDTRMIPNALSSSLNSSTANQKSWVSVGRTIYGGTNANSGLAVAIANDGRSLFIGEPGAGIVRSLSSKTQTIDPIGFRIGNSYDPWFGSSVACSHDGSVVAISSYKHDNYRGLVRVYVWDGSKWIKLGDDLLGDKDGDWFGWDVDISENGRSIIVGAYVENSPYGYARVFDIKSDGWKRRGEDLVGNNTAAFGFSVATSSDGNIVAIGAPKESYAEIHQWISNKWSILGNRIYGSIESHFGNSVALSSKEGIILAVGDDLANSGRGAVFMYEWRAVSSEWRSRGDDAVIYGDDSNDHLGGRISMSEDGNIVAYNSRAKVGVSSWDGAVWREQGVIDIHSPASVSLSGDGNVLAVGMPHDDSIDVRAGATSIFQWQ